MGNSKSKQKKPNTKSVDEKVKSNKPLFTRNAQNGRIYVMGFIRQKIENDLQLSLPKEIKEMIHIFWGKWINIQIGDKVYVKDEHPKWDKGIIKYHKRSNEPFPQEIIQNIPMHGYYTNTEMLNNF